MAIGNRSPSPGGTIIHSNHGVQDGSWAFTQRARASGLLHSMGSIGDCVDCQSFSHRIPQGSGSPGGRHRINHGGHRQLNAAIYRTVIVRMGFHQPTIDYVARRTSEGKTKREIIRGLIGEVSMLRPNPWAVTPR